MLKKITESIIILFIIIMFSSCKQEKILFYPQKLSQDYKYSFDADFKEFFFKVDDKTKLNGLLFKSDSSKGLIFYLHGNAGSLADWGEVGKLYLNFNYDVFIFDYRGYGKSQGNISGESQLYNDIQEAYDFIKNGYDEKQIVIIGYSIGTGLAAHLAMTNNPKMLILIAPFYNMIDLTHHYFKMIPSFLVKYKFKTNEFILKISKPILIFHGDKDEVIYYGSSIKLSKLLKNSDRFITLKGQKHNGINDGNDIFV
jgi:hypothetical protein